MEIIVKKENKLLFTFDVNINLNEIRNVREMIEKKKDFTTLKIVVLEKLPDHKQDQTLAALAEIEKDVENFTFVINY